MLINQLFTLSFTLASFLGPCLVSHVVDVSVIIFIPIRIHFVVFAEEGSLVECVFVRKISSLGNLVLLGKG